MLDTEYVILLAVLTIAVLAILEYIWLCISYPCYSIAVHLLLYFMYCVYQGFAYLARRRDFRRVSDAYVLQRQNHSAGLRILPRLPMELREMVLHAYFVDKASTSSCPFQRNVFPHEEHEISRLLESFLNIGEGLWSEAVAAYYSQITYTLWWNTYQHIKNPQFRDTMPLLRHMKIAIPLILDPIYNSTLWDVYGSCFIYHDTRDCEIHDLDVEQVSVYRKWLMSNFHETELSTLRRARNLQTVQFDLVYVRGWGNSSQKLLQIVTTAAKTFTCLRTLRVVVTIDNEDLDIEDSMERFDNDSGVIDKVAVQLGPLGFALVEMEQTLPGLRNYGGECIAVFVWRKPRRRIL